MNPSTHTRTLNGWLCVSLEGFAQQNHARPKEHLVKELIQNAMDAIPKNKLGSISLDSYWDKERKEITISCIDNGEGVKDIENIRTIFWTSKQDSHLKRGRMGRGFKEMLCLCKHAQVQSLGKIASFQTNNQGNKEVVITDLLETSPIKGTTIRMIMDWEEKVNQSISNYLTKFLVPSNMELYFNSEKIKKQTPTHTIAASLPTETFDGVRWVKPTLKTEVELYALKEGEKEGLIYEMGIPICPVEWDLNYHVNILQRVPMNPNRDAVMSGYPQKLHKACLPTLAIELSSETARSAWVGEAALATKDLELQKKILEVAFGQNLARSVPKFGKFDYDADAKEVAGSKILDTKQLSGGFREMAKQLLPTSKFVADEVYEKAAKAAAENTVDPDDAQSQYLAIINQYGKEKIKEVCSFHKFIADNIMEIVFPNKQVKCKVKTAIMKGTAEATWSNHFSILTLALDVERIWENPFHKDNFSLIIHETAHELAAHHGESFANAVEQCAGAACKVLIDKQTSINNMIDKISKL